MSQIGTLLLGICDYRLVALLSRSRAIRRPVLLSLVAAIFASLVVLFVAIRKKDATRSCAGRPMGTSHTVWRREP